MKETKFPVTRRQVCASIFLDPDVGSREVEVELSLSPSHSHYAYKAAAVLFHSISRSKFAVGCRD